MRPDRAPQATPGQEVAADRGFLLRGDPRPANVLALGLRARHARPDPFSDEGALELREARHDAEDQLALSSRGESSFTGTSGIVRFGARTSALYTPTSGSGITVFVTSGSSCLVQLQVKESCGNRVASSQKNGKGADQAV